MTQRVAALIARYKKFSGVGAYDLIFSNAALQWCGDHPGLFRRLRDGLKANGQLAVQKPMNLLSPDAYASLLFDLGFREQKVFLRVYDHILENREGVFEWVKGSLLTHFQSHMAPADYLNFEAEFRARLLKDLPDRRPFFYPFKRLLLWGRV